MIQPVPPPLNKICLLNTSCDQQLHFGHPLFIWNLPHVIQPVPPPLNKICLLNTSCDQQLHFGHPSTSPELQDHSIVGSAEPESILDSECLVQLDSISVSSQATCNIETKSLPEFEGQLDHTILSPTYVFSGHHDYELFLLQKENNAPHDNLSHQDTHVYGEQDQDVILTHATILSHTFASPQFIDQHNYEDHEHTDTPITVPTAFQVSYDHTLHT